MRKIRPHERKFLEFTESFPEGMHMLDKVAKSQSTKVFYSKGCKYLSDYLKKGLSEIVQEYQKDVKQNAYDAYDKWERIFDDFAVHLRKDFDLASQTVATLHVGAKALINANVPRSMRLQAKTPESSSRTIPGVTIEELKDIYNIADVRDRAIIAFLKDSGMSRADALTLNIGDLEGFNKGEQWICLKVFRAKESVEYETFVGPNAAEALKAYFTVRQKQGENLTAESPLFVTDHRPFTRLSENTLSVIFDRIKGSSGKTVSSHRLRKFFETYMALVVRHPIILKYWMGHKVKGRSDIEARYIIPPTPEQLKLYKEAYHNIDLTGGTLEERAKQAAKEQLEKMLTPEQREIMAKSGLRFTRKKGLVSEPTKEDENCEHGEHCSEDDYKQIAETELLQHLKDGWEIAYKLSDGQVIVRRA